MNPRQMTPLTRGLILVIAGTLLMALQFVQSARESVVFFLVGGTFLAFYFYRNNFGFLTTGCLVLGFGLGNFLGSVFTLPGEIGSIGLGFGFFGVTLMAYIYEGEKLWWPLIPGGILILSGIATSFPQLLRWLSLGLPAILMLAGLVFVGLEMLSRRRG